MNRHTTPQQTVHACVAVWELVYDHSQELYTPPRVVRHSEKATFDSRMFQTALSEFTAYLNATLLT